jgi:hypothetical protein
MRRGKEDVPIVFEHACRLGLEGIVSKRWDSGYRSDRSPHWFKSKNPTCAAVRREADEEFPRMVCTRCGMIGADVRPDWGPHVNKRHV